MTNPNQSLADELEAKIKSTNSPMFPAGFRYSSHEVGAFLESLLPRIRELEAMFERLPKTADGASIIPGQTRVWIDPAEPGGWADADQRYEEGADPIEVLCGAHFGDHFYFQIIVDGEVDWRSDGDHWFSDCYSTEPAARAAGGE